MLLYYSFCLWRSNVQLFKACNFRMDYFEDWRWAVLPILWMVSYYLIHFTFSSKHLDIDCTFFNGWTIWWRKNNMDTIQVVRIIFLFLLLLPPCNFKFESAWRKWYDTFLYFLDILFYINRHYINIHLIFPEIFQFFQTFHVFSRHFMFFPDSLNFSRHFMFFSRHF